MKPDQLELSVFGQKIVIRHRAEDPALAGEAAKWVTGKLKEAQARTPPGAAPHHVMLVALLDVAAEYLMAKNRTEDLMRRMDEKSAQLQAWIEAESR